MTTTTNLNSSDPIYFDKIKGIEVVKNYIDFPFPSTYYTFTNSYDTENIDNGNIAVFDTLSFKSFIKNEYEPLKQQVAGNTSTIATLQNTISTLSNQLGVVQSQIATLNSTVNSLSNTLKSLSPALGTSLLNTKLL